MIVGFISLAEWPSECRQGDFVIGVLGTSRVADELEACTAGLRAGIQPVRVERYASADVIGRCHILFVPFSMTRQIRRVVSMIAHASTLVITEKHGALEEGSAINFVILDGQVKYQLSEANAGRYGIRFSDALSQRAVSTL